MFTHSFRPTIIFNGQPGGKVAKEAKNIMQKLPRSVCTASKKGKMDEKSFLFTIKESTRGLLPHGDSCLYTIDGAPCHMHSSACSLLRSLSLQMYVSAPNTTPYSQGCDKVQINQAFGKSVQEFFTAWLCDILENLEDNKAVPAPPRFLVSTWVRDSWEILTLLMTVRAKLAPLKWFGLRVLGVCGV